MSSNEPGRWRINPVVIGWVLGLAAVGIGVYVVGFPLQSYLEGAGYSETVADAGLLIGGIVGFVGLYVLFKLAPPVLDRLDALR